MCFFCFRDNKGYFLGQQGVNLLLLLHGKNGGSTHMVKMHF